MAGRYVDGKVGYFPYIKTDTSLFYLNEGNVIKSKYDKNLFFLLAPNSIPIKGQRWSAGGWFEIKIW